MKKDLSGLTSDYALNPAPKCFNDGKKKKKKTQSKNSITHAECGVSGFGH